MIHLLVWEVGKHGHVDSESRPTQMMLASLIPYIVYIKQDLGHGTHLVTVAIQ